MSGSEARSAAARLEELERAGPPAEAIPSTFAAWQDELERLRFLERCQRVDERELERRRGAS